MASAAAAAASSTLLLPRGIHSSSQPAAPPCPLRPRIGSPSFVHFHAVAGREASSSALSARGGCRGSPAHQRTGVVCFSAPSSSSSSVTLPAALLFDCDGVLVDTEKDGHRISFNETFAERDLGVTWDEDLYGELLKIGGGKERMTAYFNRLGWPTNAPKKDEERKDFIASLHKRKTELFMALIEKKLLPLRPGVVRLIDEALGKDIKVAVCSTSNEKAVSAIVSFLLGPDRAEKISIFAGDVVPKKKPDPAIYLLAASTLGVEPSSCVVVEDSAIGLAAAKSAGMKCIITKSGI
uniref:Protein CbbY n=1 Tax=Anthurium amnicola TaxID=1678845 RepID=A0A1D1YL23_9ARAE